MNTEKHLDEQVRQALEKLQARFNDHAWEAFEQRLDQDAAADGPSQPAADSPFDEVISSKLTQLQVPLANGDWSQMEKMIEAEETAEQLENEAVVDDLVFEKFEKFEVAFQPHHWQMMTHRLEEEFFFRYHLLRCKAAEAALMLLLLLTIVHYSPLLNNSQAQHKSDSSKLTLPQVPSAKSLEIITPTSPQEPPVEVKATRPIAAAVTPKKAFVPPAASKTKQPADEQSIANTIPPVFALNNLSDNETSIKTLPPIGAGAVASMSSPATLLESMTQQRFLKNSLATPSMTNANLGIAPLIASLDAQPVQSSFAWEVLQLPEFIFEKSHQLRFSIFTSTDATYVITPPNKYSVFDTLVAVDADTTLASGYGGGIMVSWKKNKWEIQTGGIYSFKRYIPNTPAFLFETVNYYIREEFNGVQLDILQVPFNISYHLKNEGKWRVYGNVGASGHFITSSVYEIETDRTPSFSNFAMLPITDGLPDDDKSIREEKKFPDGLFDGGNIHDNLYFTANFGIGMERFVSPRWSVFFQPNYQHHFLTDGIGVNGEKLYNFSFYLGTKVSLK